MKAIQFKKYGSPDELMLVDIPKPTPKENEILVKIHAATVTAGDCEIRRMDFPWWIRIPIRIALGIFSPRRKHQILGMESSGVVEQIGAKVTRFKVGDEVYSSNGLGLGGYAEYVCQHSEKATMLKPSNMNFKEAATIPVGAVNGHHFTQLADIKSQEKVMIYGATGSIGTYAIQFASLYTSNIHAVGSPGSEELIRSLGATKFIDYTLQDFTELNETYDVIIDCVGKANFKGSLESLNPNGRLVLANPKMSQMLSARRISKRTGKKVIYKFASETHEKMEEIGKIIQSGKVRSVIDREYTLEQVPEAHRYVELGNKIGHVVVAVASEY
jgi:NADPH:quinone reductase-like Zn-dependent oxidoreductase